MNRSAVHWWTWFAVLVGSVFALGFLAGDALGATAPRPGVECVQLTFRDEVRGRVFVRELCYRTRPVAIPTRLGPSSSGPACTPLRPCPVAS